MGPRCWNRRNYLHLLHLILNDQGFGHWVAFLSIKLSPEEGISSANCSHFGNIIVTDEMDSYSEVKHPSICKLGCIRLLCKGTISSKWNIFTEQWITWLSKVCEFKVSIISCNEWELGSTISHLYPMQGLVSLKVSHLYEEGMHTMILALWDQPSIEDAMGCWFTETARPELDGTHSWCVENNLLTILIISSCRLQVLYVTAMSDFCLSICASNLQITNKRHPLFRLFFRG